MTTSGLTAGDFRHPITIERREGVDDGAGGKATVWTKVADVFCAVQQKSATEQFADGSIGRIRSQSMYKFTMWNRNDIATGMRILFDGREFNVRSLNNDLGRNKFLIVEAEAGVAQ